MRSANEARAAGNAARKLAIIYSLVSITQQSIIYTGSSPLRAPSLTLRVLGTPPTRQIYNISVVYQLTRKGTYAQRRYSK